jgi:hypothetical protein
MRIRTQTLPNSFSSDNKKTKGGFARNCASDKRFGERDFSESIDQLAVAAKPRTAMTPKKAMKALQYRGKLRGY